MMEPTTTFLILAGGKGRRLGGQDKGLIKINGQPAIEYILDTLDSVSGNIMISANRNLEHYRRYGFPVLTDNIGNYQGPLAGIATALQNITTNTLLTLPCDCPLINRDFLMRMTESLQEANETILVAHDGKRMQQLHALIPVSQAAQLDTYLAAGNRRVDHWFMQQHIQLIDFSDNPAPFYNSNTQEDIRQLAALIQTSD